MLADVRNLAINLLSFRRLSLGVFALCCTLGGAGEDYPFIALTLQLACAGLLFLLPPEMIAALAARGSRSKLVLLALTAMLLLAQLAPLPPEIWTALPARTLVVEALRAADLPLGWRPLTVDPSLTIASLYEAIPALTFFLIGMGATRRVHREFAVVIVVAAIIAALLSMLQRGFGPGSVVDLFPSSHSGRSPGLFVNRNHQACFLLATMPMVGALARELTDRWRAQPAVLATVVVASLLLMAAAILATASRAGAFLLAPVLLATAWLAIGLTRRLVLGAAGAVAATALVLVTLRVDALEIVMTRFATVEDDRVAFWSNTGNAIRAFWPIGSGLGTFPQVYALYERIGDVSTTYPYNAHNDYMQLALELGLPGVALILAWCALLAIAAKRIMASRSNSALPVAALLSLLVILAHSVVDYPSRSISLGALAGFLFGLLLNPQTAGLNAQDRAPWGTEPSGAGFGRPRILAGIISLPLFGLLAWCMTVDARITAYLLQPPVRPLVFYASQSAFAANALAQDAFARGRLGEARKYALSAVALSPLDPQGLTELTLVAQARHQEELTRRLVYVLKQMGWRQPVTQYVLAFDAAEREDLASAVSRADAVLRQGQHKRELFPFLRQATDYEDGRRTLTLALARIPDWREDFLHGLADLDNANVDGHLRLLRDLAKTAAPPTVEEYDRFVQWLLARQNYGLARRALNLSLAGKLSGSTDKLLVASGLGFENQLVWQFDSAAGINLKSSESGIAITVDEPFHGRVMRLMSTANAGDHILALEAKTAIASFDELTWTLKCPQGQERLAIERSGLLVTDGTYRVTYRFIVPPHCPSQQVELRLDHPAGARLELLIERAMIM